MNTIDRFGIWLSRFSSRWMNWWKERAGNFNIFDENTPNHKKGNPFYWMGSMIYILLILQVCLGIVLTFLYVPDTTPVEKINPELVTYAHGHTYADVMEEAEEIHSVILEHYDFTDSEKALFEVVGMKDYEYFLENLEFSTDAPTVEQLIEQAQSFEDQYDDMDDAQKENIDDNFLQIMEFADEDAEELISSTYHAGLNITDAVDEAEILRTEISDLYKVFRKTEDQVVLISNGLNDIDEDGNAIVLDQVIKDANQALSKPSEELTNYETSIISLAGYTRDELIEETEYLGMSVSEAIIASERLEPVFVNLSEYQRKVFGEMIDLIGKSADTIAEELEVTISRAYESVAKISSKPLTQWIRGIHRYGAYAFIALLMLRWIRMFFCGEFKKPGELTWIVLTVIVVVSTFSGVTGYLLPFDQRSYWATTVGTQMLNSVDSMPVVGPLGIGTALKYMGLGAHQVGQSTILRFNILHYFLPILMLLMAEIYFLRSRKKRPKLNWIVLLILVLVIVSACLYLPAVNEPPPNTAKTPDHILPDWYFLFVYFYLKFLPGYVGTLITLLFIVFLVMFPIFDRRPEKSAKGRPGLTTLGIGGLLFFLAGSLFAYWVPFESAHRQMYVNGILLFNGFIFIVAFILYVIWRYRKMNKKNSLALRLGIDPKLIEVCGE